METHEAEMDLGTMAGSARSTVIIIVISTEIAIETAIDMATGVPEAGAGDGVIPGAVPGAVEPYCWSRTTGDGAAGRAEAVTGVPQLEPEPGPGACASAGDKSGSFGQQMITTLFISLHFSF